MHKQTTNEFLSFNNTIFQTVAEMDERNESYYKIQDILLTTQGLRTALLTKRSIILIVLCYSRAPESDQQSTYTSKTSEQLSGVLLDIGTSLDGEDIDDTAQNYITDM